ncbi:MAG: BlaI/MecI/CopY family transcriptional regulator [Pseudomonadota bacterium]
MASDQKLSRREREVMDVLYREGRAAVAQVREQMPDPPSYSSVRAMLRVLEEKGHVRHEQDGPRYLYVPTTPLQQARTSALKRVLSTFFDDSPEQVLAALLDLKHDELTDDQLDELEAKIASARREDK